jgi:two-component sensor histidine kinase
MNALAPVPTPPPAAPGVRSARPYLEDLAGPFAGARQRIHVACDLGLSLPIGELAAIGGIVAEALSNALRHGFPANRDGDIWLSLSEAGGRITLAIRDNGIGVPDLTEDPDRGRGRIAALARQLGGQARINSAPFGGAQVLVVYPRAR